MVIGKRTYIPVLMLAFAWQGVATAGIIEVGALNIIDDAGNPSDGLRYLDMTYSDGLSQAAALANAQATYANARLATPSEFDALFQASGINYDGALKASDGFATGVSATISSFGNYDAGVLTAQLGDTAWGNTTFIWTDPEGSFDGLTTRDYVSLHTTYSQVAQTSNAPPNDMMGWLIVSDATVPEPSTLAALGGLLGMGLIGRWWRRRKAA